MISKSTIAQIMDSIDVVEVIQDFVPLKKKGSNYGACCPFHNEKTPSFSVSATKQIYKCFGCGKAGDAIKFVKDHEGFSYIEALKYLAGKYNIIIEEEETTEEYKEQKTQRDSLFIVLNYAKDYYQKLLFESDEGKSIGLSYFKERGFSEEIIKEFELGYSMDSWEFFSNEALKKGYKDEFLVNTGLSFKKENGKLIDAYRGRVMFPIHDVAGKVVGFGGRTLKADKKEAKYINTKETDVYSKRKVLYGAFQAKNEIRNEDVCYLVEGYTDVVSVHQGGIKNVVASSGTSLTVEQIRLIYRYTKNIVFLFDGDDAGMKAAQRGIDIALEEGINVEIVTFPDGEDPDSYIRKVGGDQFKKHIQETKQDFISYKSNLILKDVGNDPIRKSKAIREVVESISKIEDNITREVYTKQCASIFDVDEATIVSEVNKLKIKGFKDKKNQSERAEIDQVTSNNEPLGMRQETQISKSDVIVNQELEIVRLLLNYSTHNIGEDDNFAEFLLQSIADVEITDAVCKRIIGEFQKSLEEGEVLSANYFFKFNDDNLEQLVVDLIAEKYELSENWKAKKDIDVPLEEHILDAAVFNSVMRLKWKNIHFLIEENNDKLKTSNEEETIELLQFNMAYKEAERQIATQLGNVIFK